MLGLGAQLELMWAEMGHLRSESPYSGHWSWSMLMEKQSRTELSIFFHSPL